MKTVDAIIKQFGDKAILTADDLKEQGLFRKWNKATLERYGRERKHGLKGFQLATGDTVLFYSKDIAELIVKQMEKNK